MAHERHPNKGRAPRDKEAMIYVEFRNGRVTKEPTPVRFWRFQEWPDGPCDFDIHAYWRAEK